MGIMRYQTVIVGIKVMKNPKDSDWNVTNIE